MPASQAPFVSIVIPCRNEAGRIEDCLSSVLRQDQPQGGFEIIVADGMSDDGTREILARLAQEVGVPTVLRPSSFGSHPAIRVINNPGRIVSTGLNAAIEAARGDIIIRMDAHTNYDNDYVRKCIETLEQTKADNVGGPARTKADSFLAKAIAAAYHSQFSVGGARFHDVDYEGWVDTVTYGCWRREAFERFGYFDEELVRNQDDEHNLRIIRGGGRIWQSPKINSRYRPRGSLSSLFTQYMQYGYWKMRVIQKHKLPAAWRHLVPGAFVLTLSGQFLLSAFCFLVSVFSRGRWSVVSGQRWHLNFQISAFSLLLLCSAYIIADLGASIVTAAKNGWKLLPLLPAVFACYHFGYGYGFLRGVWDFVIRRKRPRSGFANLTR